MVINGQGQFTGNPGYARNATARTAPGFSDPLMVHILPGQGQPAIEERGINSTDTAGITPTDPMCKKTQQTQIQGSGLPRLSAAPGSLVALRYQENGHVTLPQNQPGKPPNRGSVYIYGTTQPKPDENFLDVFNQWNADGTGGDKRGKLLATQPFDDGHCYQVNSGSISQQRLQQYPHPADQLMGADLWCQNDIKLPIDAVSGKPYTLYWVWDWPTEPGVDPSLPKGKAEIYTTCMDVDITAANKRDFMEPRALQARASGNGAVNSAAIPSYMSSLSASGSSAPIASSTLLPTVPSTQVGAAQASTPQASASASTPPAGSSPETPMNPSVAASIVEAAIGSEISSMFAAQSAAATITVTPQDNIATATTQAQSPAAQSSANQASSAVQTSTPSSPSDASMASIPNAAASPNSPATQAAPASPAGNPPASMNIQPPLISGVSGTATAVTAVPSAMPSSSVVAGAGTAIPDAFSGTAMPAGSTVPVSTAASPGTEVSASPKCKKAKRSRIMRRA